MDCPDCKIPMTKIDKYQDGVHKCPRCGVEISEDDDG